jgi:hypothetical protein
VLIDFGTGSPYLVILIGFALGLGIGRWWIVPIPLLLTVAHIPADHPDSPPWMMALFFLSLPLCVSAFVGVAARKAGSRVLRGERRGSRPSEGA